MALILDFRSHAARGDAREQPAHEGAQIIIFPGVRRERHVEAAKPARRKSRPKRDRLEIPD
jgi:hypothetical protein